MNMAMDQAIMEAVAAGNVPPTLRFYDWMPACLSLGYTQPITDVDRERLAACGWHLVRRLTGGRAILHIDELTYSVALPATDPIVAGSIVESYRRLSTALLNGLNQLGASAEADKQVDGHSQSKGPVCFEVSSHYEVTIGGKKLIGSAQVRKFGAVLQHGSLPLTGDIARICDTLVFPDETERDSARERVRQRAATLQDGMNRIVSWQQAADSMAQSFQETFRLTIIQETDLTPEEKTRAIDLRAQQYATEDWNARF
jgi:lipoate-protein ligase A